MSFTFFVALFYMKLISAEWVKLPNISPTTQVPRVVFKLAQPAKNSFFSSETLKSVISLPATTEATIFKDNISTRKSYIRQYFHTTVTSHVLNVLGNLSNLTSNEEILEPVLLHSPEKNKNRVIYFNKTVQMNVIPEKTKYQIFNMTDEKFGNNNQNVNYHENDDDGMTLSDNDAEDVYYDDEYYYEYEDETTKFNPFVKKISTSTTTTLPPKTNKKKISNQKLQRRTMIQLMNSKQYKPFNDVSFTSFIKFLRKIQESFAIRTAKTIGDKIKMLVTFRDQLMTTINRQIRRLWRGNQASTKKSSGRRSKRTLGLDHSQSSGAMDFPSAEGALLSICFLTFAVFLIKLVLQVIQTIKMKKAMWATQMMMGTENVVIKRQKRSTDEDLQKLVNIYDSIEKLKLKY